MKTLFYLILAIVGFTMAVTGTIKLSSLSISSDNILLMVSITLVGMIFTTLFGHAFYIHRKDLIN